jgi:hypothetical protein
MSYTPGPWAIEKDSKDIVKVRAYATVATCTTAGLWDSKRTQVISPEECMANARLIAAAPELLEALEFALAALEDVFGKNKVDVGAINTARAAIAKARGQE